MTFVPRTFLERVLVESAEELFEATSIPNAKATTRARWGEGGAPPELVAIAPIRGSSSGALLLGASFSLFSRTRPDSPRIVLEPERAADWILARDRDGKGKSWPTLDSS